MFGVINYFPRLHLANFKHHSRNTKYCSTHTHPLSFRCSFSDLCYTGHFCASPVVSRRKEELYQTVGVLLQRGRTAVRDHSGTVLELFLSQRRYWMSVGTIAWRSKICTDNNTIWGLMSTYAIYDSTQYYTIRTTGMVAPHFPSLRTLLNYLVGLK